MSELRAAAIEAGAEALFANNASEWGPIAKTKKAVRYRDDLGAIYDAMAPLIRQDERQATADELHDFATREYSGAMDMACQERTMRLAARLVVGGQW